MHTEAAWGSDCILKGLYRGGAHTQYLICMEHEGNALCASFILLSKK